MRKIFALAVVALFTANACVPSEEASAPAGETGAASEIVQVDAPVVALTHVGVIDGTGAEARSDQTVLLREGRVEAVGAFEQVEVPSGAEVLDLTGHTVMPGIVGLHDHMYLSSNLGSMRPQWDSYPPLFLANGVTTIRTTGSVDPYQELNLRAAIEAGERVGPEIFVTGPYLQGPTSNLGVMHALEGEEDARRMVRYWADEGVSWFKAYTTISRAELGAAIDEAHMYGVKVTAHLCSVTFQEAVELGIDHLEHGLLTNTDFASGKTPDACPRSNDYRPGYADLDMESPEVQETIRMMVGNGVGMTSTLAVYEEAQRVPESYLRNPRFRAVLHPDVLEWVQQQYDAGRANPVDWFDDSYRAHMDFEVAFYRAGGTLAAGSDPCCVWVIAGFGDQRNYEVLIEAGFTPGEAVQIMTSNGAKVLGIEGRVGTILPGMQADLIVLEGDLAGDAEVIRRPQIVFRKGVGYNSEALLESIRGQVGVE